MALVTLRSVKGSPLTNLEVDTNFTLLDQITYEYSSKEALIESDQITPDDTFRHVTITNINGTFNINAPSSGAYFDIKPMILRISTVTGCTLTWDSIYKDYDDNTLITSISAASFNYLCFLYDNMQEKWLLMGTS